MGLGCNKGPTDKTRSTEAAKGLRGKPVGSVKEVNELRDRAVTLALVRPGQVGQGPAGRLGSGPAALCAGPRRPFLPAHGKHTRGAGRPPGVAEPGTVGPGRPGPGRNRRPP